jgi:hypothetical protein
MVFDAEDDVKDRMKRKAILGIKEEGEGGVKELALFARGLSSTLPVPTSAGRFEVPN